jgi:nuclear pore complex protein Nup205
MAPGVVEILCETVLVSMTTLVATISDSEMVPVERLGSTLQAIVDAACRPGTTENARGNLYASISQLLQLLASSALPDDVSIIEREPTANLQRAALSVFAAKKDRFIPLLCRDAIDDREVWKTECFSLLGCLVSICQTERASAMLSPLMVNGFLPLFVRSIKDREMALLECLSDEFGESAAKIALIPDDLHAYWVYESKIAFLLAIAATQKGSEDLLDSGVFEMFATCGFMTVQPIEDGTGGSRTSLKADVQRLRLRYNDNIECCIVGFSCW